MSVIWRCRRRGSAAGLQVVYEWEEALMELEIPKLSVQTLVENAIKHGLEKVTSTVTIGVKASIQEDGTALIAVQDDGPGFTQGRLGQVEDFAAARMGPAGARQHWARQPLHEAEAAVWGRG